MIKAIFTFFQVQIESPGRHAAELLQSSFGKRPEAFNAVNVNIANRKHIVRMVDSKIFRANYINQSDVTAPRIGTNHQIKCNTSANNVLQRLSSGVRHNPGYKLWRCAYKFRRQSSCCQLYDRLAANSTRTKLRFVNFNFASSERLSAFRFLSDTISIFQINLINRLSCQISQKSGFLRRVKSSAKYLMIW
jgi:hypothetical protein